MNPIKLKCVNEIPNGFHVSPKDVEKYFFAVSSEESTTLTTRTESLQTALKGQKIFLLDFESLEDFVGEHVVEGEKRFVYLPHIFGIYLIGIWKVVLISRKIYA